MGRVGEAWTAWRSAWQAGRSTIKSNWRSVKWRRRGRHTECQSKLRARFPAIADALVASRDEMSHSEARLAPRVYGLVGARPPARRHKPPAAAPAAPLLQSAPHDARPPCARLCGPAAKRCIPRASGGTRAAGHDGSILGWRCALEAGRAPSSGGRGRCLPLAAHLPSAASQHLEPARSRVQQQRRAEFTAESVPDCTPSSLVHWSGKHPKGIPHRAQTGQLPHTQPPSQPAPTHPPTMELLTCHRRAWQPPGPGPQRLQQLLLLRAAGGAGQQTHMLLVASRVRPRKSALEHQQG